MALTREEVLHVARLARVGLSDADVEKFRDQLSSILEHFDVLRSIDTTGVEPTTHPLPLVSVMGDDEPRESLTPEQVLANAPQVHDGYLRVRAVLDD